MRIATGSSPSRSNSRSAWPIRVAEDTSVLDLMSGREVGVGAGGNLSAFSAFAQGSADRHGLFASNLALLRRAWTSGELPGGDRLYPAGPGLADRIWQASFSADGGARAGFDGDGVLLSRTQLRPAGDPHASIEAIQAPILDAYYAALPPNRPGRVLMSRSVFVADDRDEAMRLAAAGLRRARQRLGLATNGSLADWIRAANSHVGTPDDVIASLAADHTLDRATELAVQVHSIDPPHAMTLRSMEPMAHRVAPALGWSSGLAAPSQRQAA